MSKANKETMAQYSGAQWMLRLIEEKGLERAKEEMNWRCNFEVPLGIADSELKRYSHEVKHNTVESYSLFASATLRDEFGFGHDRLTRFKNIFENKCECLMMGYCNFDDYQEVLKDEVKMNFEIDESCKNALRRNSIGVYKRN